MWNDYTAPIYNVRKTCDERLRLTIDYLFTPVAPFHISGHHKRLTSNGRLHLLYFIAKQANTSFALS